jgi:hypothetical protein
MRYRDQGEPEPGQLVCRLAQSGQDGGWLAVDGNGRPLQAKAAADLLERRGHGVSRCAVDVLIGEAVDLADGIIAATADLARQRADLDALSQLLTVEGRRLNASAAPLPAVISRALYPADPVLTRADRGIVATDWRVRYAALREGWGEAESEIEDG